MKKYFDLPEVAKKIESLSSELGKAKNVLKARAERKAQTKANYHRLLATTILKLQNGKITEFEGEQIEKVSVTNSENLAKGILWKELLEMEEAEGLYKTAFAYIEVTTTQLQGYQTIYKHLDNV